MITMLVLRNSVDGARCHEGTGSDPVPSCGSGTVRQARLPGASKSPARSPSRNARHSSRSNLSSGPAGSFESRIRTSFGVNETSMHALESQTLLRIHCGLEAPWLPLTFILQYTNRCVRTDSLWHRHAKTARGHASPYTLTPWHRGQLARGNLPQSGFPVGLIAATVHPVRHLRAAPVRRISGRPPAPRRWATAVVGPIGTVARPRGPG
jgi:hypothetical protein